MRKFSLVVYLVVVWLLIDYPLGFWLFVIGATLNWALQARKYSTDISSRRAVHCEREQTSLPQAWWRNGLASRRDNVL